MRLAKLLIGCLVVLVVNACGGGGGGSASSQAATYTVGGTISGLSSGPLVLKNNGGDALTINANSNTFTFSTGLADAAVYAVTVDTQPNGLTCSVSNGAGNISTANITNATVSCSVNWVGTKQLGVVGSTYGASVNTDTNGNIYICGLTDGGLDGNTRTGDDFFFTKYNSSGVKQYTRQMGSGALTGGNSVATDASGNVYIGGYVIGGLDGNNSSGSLDFFITKYNSSGVKQYTRQMGGVSGGTTTYGLSVATDPSGNVYIGGYTDVGLDGNTQTGSHDFFITKYDSSGVKQYTRQLGVAGRFTEGRSVATDASGNVYIGGHTSGGLDGNTLTGLSDFFITKYNSSGVKQYTRQLGVAGRSTLGLSVATDASGNVYIGGYTRGGLDGNILTGTYDFFITKYNSSGVKQYTRQLGVAGLATQGWSVATDAIGNVYIGGLTEGGLDGNTLTGTSDFFITKYNSSGVKQYTRQLGVAGVTTVGYSVATDASGNVYIGGYTEGGLDGNTLTGTSDFFITKYNSSGVKQ